jgi:hypothetical protein
MVWRGGGEREGVRVREREREAILVGMEEEGECRYRGIFEVKLCINVVMRTLDVCRR